MITLRLFEAANPFNQIGAYQLKAGEVVIGRDQSADWRIEDRFGDLSRRHCVIRRDDDRICILDTSANGVFVGRDKAPVPQGVDFRLAHGQTIYLGQYAILVDGEGDAAKLSDPPARRADDIPTDAALLEHFCIGAGLEPSSFAGEDPRMLMQRLGAVYRQVVDDLCDLLRDRAMVKSSLQIDRTTISAQDNNPLKWAPPHRVAVELLQEGEGSFLKGREAFKASFDDLRRHGAAVTESSRAAITFLLDELDPARIETSAKSQSLGFLGKSEAVWKKYLQVHAALASDASGERGRISAAMRAGYAASINAHVTEEDAA